MLIIIEGPDKSGKTTLARAIEKKFGYKYEHFGPPGPDPAGEYARFLINLKEPTVCDRFYLGEQVYGPLLRKESLITDLQKVVIERLCRYRGAILIYACAPLHICQDRLIRDKDENITLDQNKKAWDMFFALMQTVPIQPICLYDSTEQNALEKCLVEIDSISKIMRAMAGLAHVYCNGIGTISNDKMVIVGEKLNERITWVGKPFDKGLSSEFLYSCMQDAKIPEIRVYICNANKLSVEEAIFLRYGNTEPWLALGSPAHDLLSELQITHSFIPHPQYWKRFKNGEYKEYIGMLKLWKDQYYKVRKERV